MMKFILGVGLLALAACSAQRGEGTAEAEQTQQKAERPRPVTVEDRFAVLALDCVHREYPNKTSHVMQSPADMKTPRELTPAFYGCFDWHSSVHRHWLLSRLLNTDPGGVLAAEIKATLARSFTAENIAGELAYYTAEGRSSFERPYGVAWFLQLVSELEESSDPEVKIWRETLLPVEDAIVEQIRAWLPNLSYPIRLGTHNQTSFAFGLMLDYARSVGDEALQQELIDKILAFHSADLNCPLAYEPSGEDFLSPCLMEADLMRRIMSRAEFAVWLGEFLPQLPQDGGADWLEPGVVLDPTDGKLVHLDGLNLSRAWALEGMANGLPNDDPRVSALLAASDKHRDVGIAAVFGEHYSGSHWLASFATYLTTKRGLPATGDDR